VFRLSAMFKVNLDNNLRPELWFTEISRLRVYWGRIAFIILQLLLLFWWMSWRKSNVTWFCWGRIPRTQHFKFALLHINVLALHIPIIQEISKRLFATEIFFYLPLICVAFSWSKWHLWYTFYNVEQKNANTSGMIKEYRLTHYMYIFSSQIKRYIATIHVSPVCYYLISKKLFQCRFTKQRRCKSIYIGHQIQSRECIVNDSNFLDIILILFITHGFSSIKL
jgi:hypothetical protein